MKEGIKMDKNMTAVKNQWETTAYEVAGEYENIMQGCNDLDNLIGRIMEELNKLKENVESYDEFVRFEETSADEADIATMKLSGTYAQLLVVNRVLG